MADELQTPHAEEEGGFGRASEEGDFIKVSEGDESFVPGGGGINPKILRYYTILLAGGMRC